MKIHTHFEFVDSYKGDLKQIVSKYTHEDWGKYDYRQNTFDVHKATKTIPLIWNEIDKDNKRNTNIDKLKFWPEADKYKKDLENLKEILLKKYGPGFISTALLINLPSRSVIHPHIDNYDPYFAMVNRVHLPIVTDDEVLFYVGGEERHLKEGEMFEINNHNDLHWVRNNSQIDRIHLLIDWLALDNDPKIS